MGFTVKDKVIAGGLTSIKGIGEITATKMLAGKITPGNINAIKRAESDPASGAPWACLDNFGNRLKIGRLPEDEFKIRARVWAIKDGSCIMEDINGAEKAYFEAKWVQIEEGKVYDLCISKRKYCKIDSARRV